MALPSGAHARKGLIQELRWSDLRLLCDRMGAFTGLILSIACLEQPYDTPLF